MPIEVTQTRDPSEAARLLSANRTAYLLGGGTGLMRRIHEGDQKVRHLIRLNMDALAQISPGAAGLRIGAQVTMAGVLAEPGLAALHEAAASVGSPALRNMATVGGNLFAQPPYGDLTVALLSLGAQVDIATASGTETRPLEEVLRQQTGKRVITAVHVPTGKTLFYHKMTRSQPRGASILTLAVTLGRGSGRADEVRVALGGLAGRPCRAPGAERALSSGPLTPQRIEDAAARLCDGLTPVSDALASGWYRQEMAALQLRRLLAGAREQRRS